MNKFFNSAAAIVIATAMGIVAQVEDAKAEGFECRNTEEWRGGWVATGGFDKTFVLFTRDDNYKGNNKRDVLSMFSWDMNFEAAKAAAQEFCATGALPKLEALTTPREDGTHYESYRCDNGLGGNVGRFFSKTQDEGLIFSNVVTVSEFEVGQRDSEDGSVVLSEVYSDPNLDRIASLKKLELHCGF